MTLPQSADFAPAKMCRRRALKFLSGALAAATLPNAGQACTSTAASRTGLGLVLYCCNIRRRWMRQQNPEFDLFAPMAFLEHCHQLGAGGMQAHLGRLDASRIGLLRRFAERNSLFIDASVSPPADKSDRDRFEAEMRTAAAVGVQAARTVIMPGRRYERFSSLAEFREFAQRGRSMLELAAPIVEKHRVRLAVENHKDQRIDERIALFEHLSSEFIGACVDTGNSFALLDDPYEAVQALAPHAFTVHLKDQALQQYKDGFLLGDIPLGQGSFDLRRMVKILRESKPQIRFALELITRDPLTVPCLRADYWSTMPDVPAKDLANILRFVREHPAQLQQVSSLPIADQVALEDANVVASLRYAGGELKI